MGLYVLGFYLKSRSPMYNLFSSITHTISVLVYFYRFSALTTKPKKVADSRKYGGMNAVDSPFGPGSPFRIPKFNEKTQMQLNVECEESET